MNKTSHRSRTKMDFQIPPFAKPLRVLQLVNYLLNKLFIKYKFMK